MDKLDFLFNLKLLSAFFVLIEDIDECKSRPRVKCGNNMKCTNKNGGYICECHDGYQPLNQSDPKTGCIGKISKFNDRTFCNT